MPQRPYDAVRYPTYPRIETHPDRLAAMATLSGMCPAPVTGCRVLEIGCGDGGNLIPMAYVLPESRFVGVDLAAAAIADGNALIRRLRLRNTELREQDFRDLDGEFDYIVAHGLYSWVPADVRDRLMALSGALLARQGVGYISYNTWPGRRARHALREVLLRRLRDVRGPRARLREARRLLREMGTAEAAAMAACGDDILYHDDLAPVNDPVWFEEFVAHAEGHGLQYVGEAVWRGAGAGGFRQSLLCRGDVRLKRPTASLMPRFLFSIRRPEYAQDSVTAALRDAYPLPLPFAELAPYGGDSKGLFALFERGVVDLHVFDFPCEETVTARPRATRLARAQAERSRFVTSVRHHLVELDDDDRELIQRLDGRRRGPSPRIEWLARMGLLEG